jgi:DNA invertase Pin-like site-specific DNA recombinase
MDELKRQLSLKFPHLSDAEFNLALSRSSQRTEQAIAEQIEGWQKQFIPSSGGRLPKLTAHQRAEAISMVNSGEKTASEVARLFHVHRSSISRLIAKNVLETGGL